MTNNRYLIWLHWPEKCFQVKPDDLKFFKSLVDPRSTVTCVKREREFLSALKNATHVVSWTFKEEWFSRASKLKILSTPAAGHELMPTAVPEGVKLCFSHFHGPIIAESVVGFMLAWAHGFFARSEDRRHQRVWLSDKCYMLEGTKALIVGYGRIGKVIGEKLRALGVKVEGFTRKNIKLLPKSAGLADWLIMALPANTATDNLLDEKLLRTLPQKAVVINVGRGNAIDESALIGALKKRMIAGAYLDVCKCEKSEIWKSKAKTAKIRGIIPPKPKVPNLVLMPHASAFSPDYFKRAFKEFKREGVI